MLVAGRIQNGQKVQGYLILQEVMCCVGPKPKPWASIAVPDEKACVDWGFPRPYNIVQVDSDTLQYGSGMKDADGKEIFSGDIIGWESLPFVGVVGNWAAENGTNEFHVRWGKPGKNGEMIFCSEQRLPEVHVMNGRPVILGDIWDLPEKHLRMTEGRMRGIISQAPLDELQKNAGIMVFFSEGAIGIGVSLEDDKETGGERFIYSLFCGDDKFINIEYDPEKDVIIRDLVARWTELCQG